LKTTTHLWNWACFGSLEQQMRDPNIGNTKGYERDKRTKIGKRERISSAKNDPDELIERL
jgi:hypothetical protein